MRIGFLTIPTLAPRRRRRFLTCFLASGRSPSLRRSSSARESHWKSISGELSLIMVKLVRTRTSWKLEGVFDWCVSVHSAPRARSACGRLGE